MSVYGLYMLAFMNIY